MKPLTHPSPTRRAVGGSASRSCILFGTQDQSGIWWSPRLESWMVVTVAPARRDRHNGHIRRQMRRHFVGWEWQRMDGPSCSHEQGATGSMRACEGLKGLHRNSWGVTPTWRTRECDPKSTPRSRAKERIPAHAVAARWLRGSCGGTPRRTYMYSKGLPLHASVGRPRGDHTSLWDAWVAHAAIRSCG